MRKKYNISSDKVEIQAIFKKYPEADPNDLNIDPEFSGCRPLLHLAIDDDEIEVVRFILNEAVIKANPDLVDDKSGLTPLALAIQNGSLEMVKLLVLAGADPNLPVE